MKSSADSPFAHLPRCNVIRIYLTYILLAFFLVGGFAAIQFIFVFDQFKPQLVIVPVIVSLLMGGLLGTVMVLRKRLENRNHLFRALVDFGQEFMYVRHLDGSYDYVSPYCEVLTGYSAEDFYRQPNKFAELIHPEDEDIWLAHTTHADYFNGESSSLNLRILTRRGETRWIKHLSSGIFDASGQLLGVRSTNIDITRSKEIDILKTCFMAKLSHEFRTPMNGILGCAALIEEEMPDSELKAYVGMIQDSGGRLLETLDNILALSNLESERCPVSLDLVNLVAECHAGVERIRAAAEAKGLQLHIETPPGAIEVVADPLAVQRVLNNLLGNALKFTEEGNISLRLSAPQPGERWARLEVRDTGVGISEEFLPRVFEEFRQESEGATRKFDGSGIGMAVSKRLLECMRGKIQVRSRKGQGTCFLIELPLAARPRLE